MATNGIDPGGFYPGRSFPVNQTQGGPTDPYTKTNPTPIASPSAVQPGIPSNVNMQGLSPGLLPPSGGYAGAPYLAEGGAIPDSGMGVPQGVPANDGAPAQGFDINSVMAYGRNKYGLGGEGGGGRGFVPNGSPEYSGEQQTESLPSAQHFAEGGPVDEDTDPNDQDDVTGAIPEAPPAPQGANVAGSTAQSPVLSAEHGLDLDAVGARVADKFNQARAPQAGQQTNDTLGALGNAASMLNPFTATGENGRLVGQALKQKIMQYLTGSDAAHPQQVQALERQVDPQGQMDPNDRKVSAVTAAQQQGGDEAAWSVTQHYRQKYEHSKAFALAALSHGAVGPALNAAMMAFQNLPDGQRVLFAHGAGNNITATVTAQGGAQPQQIQMTPQQLGTLLKSPQSMFDNVVSSGSAAVLSQFTQKPQGAGGLDPNTPSFEIGQGNRAQIVRPGDKGDNGRPFTNKQRADDAGVDENTIREAQSMSTDPRKQTAYIAQQRQQERTNDIAEKKAGTPTIVQQMRNEGNDKVANTRAAAARDVAGTNATSREQVAKMRVDGWQQAIDAKGRNATALELVKRRSIEQNEAKRNAIGVARTMILAGKKVADVDAYFKGKGINLADVLGQPPQVGAPQSVSTAPAGGGAAPGGAQPAKKFYNGQWYTRGPNGEAIPAGQ